MRATLSGIQSDLVALKMFSFRASKPDVMVAGARIARQGSTALRGGYFMRRAVVTAAAG